IAAPKPQLQPMTTPYDLAGDVRPVTTDCPSATADAPSETTGDVPAYGGTYTGDELVGAADDLLDLATDDSAITSAVDVLKHVFDFSFLSSLGFLLAGQWLFSRLNTLEADRRSNERDDDASGVANYNKHMKVTFR